MKKPTYYLLKDHYASDAEYKKAKERFSELGFRVVTFKAGDNGHDIQTGIKAMIKNYLNENQS